MMNMSFDKCRSCMYFPDTSMSSNDYYVDDNGVKHREMKYICRYDLHEIKSRKNICPRGSDER